MDPELLEEVFHSSQPRPFVKDLRKGLDALGLYQLTCSLPPLIHIFTPGNASTLTLKMLSQLLKPNFIPEGSNRRQVETTVYTKFIKYLREAASGRRGEITLGKIPMFVTGAEEEPVLGYEKHPSVHFQKCVSLIPTASTCINRLTLTIPSGNVQLPKDEDLFQFFDLAFVNAFFGLV